MHAANDDVDDVMSFGSSPNKQKAQRQSCATLNTVGLVEEGAGIDVSPAKDTIHSIFSFYKMIGNDGGCWEIGGGTVGFIVVDIGSR